MSTRPNQLEVNQAMMVAHQGDPGAPAAVLAREVTELRVAYELLHERLAAYDETHAELQRLKATIERVKDQVAVWRAYSDLKDCVLEIESALRG